MSDHMPSDLAAVETPALVVDLDRLDANLSRAAEYAASHGLALRPHVKTHKSPYVAAAQLRLGAKGLTCATPREAEVMAEVSDDVLLAYPPLGRARARRVAALPASLRLIVALDSEQAASELARAARDARREIGVYVELDLGMHRVGTPTVDGAVALARHVSESDGLTFEGIAFYPGHIRQPMPEQDAALETLDTALDSRARAVPRGRTSAARRERRIDAHALAHARGARRDGDQAGHIRVQRPADGRHRRLWVGRLRAHHPRDRRLHGDPRPGGDRRRAPRRWAASR